MDPEKLAAIEEARGGGGGGGEIVMSSVVEPVDPNNTAAAAAAAAAAPRAVLVTAQPVVSIAAQPRIIATTVGASQPGNQVAVGGAAANGDCCHPCGREESCCTCMKSIVWVAMVFFFLEFILSIFAIGAHWSFIGFNDGSFRALEDDHADVYVWVVLYGVRSTTTNKNLQLVHHGLS